MLPTLTTAGIGDPGGLERLVELAGRHGFAAVDTSCESLAGLVAARGLDGARAFFDQHGVRVGAVGLPVEWRRDEEAFRRGLARLPQLAEVAASLGCRCATTWMLPSVEEPGHAFALKAVRRLRLCAEVLHAYGLRLGLEYVAPYHLRRLHPHPFIASQAEMLELIDAIGRPGVGLLLDSYHWHCSGGSVAELEALPVELVVHVHINDARPGPVEELLDNDRLFPGEGAIDLHTFLSTLARKGYSGCVALEVLTRQPPPAPPEAMAARAAAAVLPLLRAVSGQ